MEQYASNCYVFFVANIADLQEETENRIVSALYAKQLNQVKIDRFRLCFAQADSFEIIL